MTKCERKLTKEEANKIHMCLSQWREYDDAVQVPTVFELIEEDYSTWEDYLEQIEQNSAKENDIVFRLDHCVRCDAIEFPKFNKEIRNIIEDFLMFDFHGTHQYETSRGWIRVEQLIDDVCESYVLFYENYGCVGNQQNH